jgi:RecJ-like exonuclease
MLNEKISLPDEINKRLLNASNLIKSTNNPIRVVSHYDGDGLCAGTVICATLARLGKKFHITLKHALEPKDELFDNLTDSATELKIFSDLGSSRLAEIEELKGWSIILDHHATQKDAKKNDVIHINTNLFGINGSYEMSASTLAFLLSIQVSKQNWDLISIALAGSIADKQHKNGFSGLNLELLNHALDLELIDEEIGLKLPEGTISQALMRSTDPYILGLSNNESGINELLNKLGIEPNLTIREINDNKLQRLISYILLKLLEQGVPPEDAEEFVTKKYINKPLKIDLEEFSHIINASGRMGEMGLGVAAGLGDQKAIAKAKLVRAEHKQQILDGLKKLESPGPKQMDNIQYFYEGKGENAGTFAGIGMMYFFNQNKPVIAITKSKENIKISGRGTKRLVTQGLDLAMIFDEVANMVKGNGGGHQIAAGATIPINTDLEFLKLVDEKVGKQLNIQTVEPDGSEK